MPGGGTDCDTIDVCGHPRLARAMREVGMTLAALTSAYTAEYPLFDCTWACKPTATMDGLGDSCDPCPLTASWT